MAHNLTIRADGTAEAFYGDGKQAWHKCGQVVEGTLTAAEAIKKAHLDWQVGLIPIFANGAEIKDHRAVARMDNGTVLGIVGTRFTPIQNESAFEFFDEVVGGGYAFYESAASLASGRKTFISARIPGDMFLKSNPNDKTEKHVLLYNAHDGSGALSMMIVGFRVECQNLLNIALKSGTNQIKIRHTRNYGNKVKAAQETLGLISAYYDNLQGVLNYLDEQTFTKQEAIAFMEKLIPSKEGEETSTRTVNTREEIVTLFENGKGNRGRTKHDLFQGITEFCTHNRSTRAGEGDETEARLTSNLFGSGAALQQRALNMLVA